VCISIRIICQVWINGGDSRTFTHPPLLLKLRPGDVAPYAASSSQTAALGIASLVAALIAALSAFSFLGESSDTHPAQLPTSRSSV
jgi:hypothetical protein